MATTTNVNSGGTRRLLYLGLTGFMVFMVVLMGITISVLKKADTRIQEVVLQYNEKSALIVRMRNSARERTVTLQKMLIERDPLYIAEELANFNHFGSDFARARFHLMEFNLTADEKRLLDRLFKLISENVPIQLEVIDLAFTDRFDVAREKLLKDSIPLQDETFSLLSKILLLQETAANNEINESRNDYKLAVLALIAVVVIGGIVTILVSTRVIRHVTLSEKIIFTQKERAETTLDSIGDAVITTDRNGLVEHLNEVAEKFLGVSEQDIVGKLMNEYAYFTIEGIQDSYVDPIAETLDRQVTVTSEGDAVLVTRSNNNYGVEYTASPIYDRQRSLTGTVLVIRDVSRLRALSSELDYYARYDSLTGLLNRREIELLLEDALAKFHTDRGGDACLCYLDLDQFKIINDTCGHTAGDELLKQVSRTLLEMTRESDIVARMGGDEFAVILRGCNSDSAFRIMDRIRERLHCENFSWDNKQFNTGASIGVVPITESMGSASDLLSAADTACYVAKEDGRNRIHMLEGDNDKAVRRKGEMEWVHRIKQAILDERFVLYFQKIKSLHGDKPGIHGEVLLRMLGSNDNIVTPFTFIPAAERYNLMPEVDRYVIQHTFALLDRFHDSCDLQDGLFSINLSAQSLCEKGFREFITSQLENFSLEPANICFEITETAMISNLAQAITLIESLQSIGCRFALDDFGSGLSSFNYLKNLPVDYLKIDGSFIKNIATEALDFAMVKSLSSIGDILGIETIAEYVETEEVKGILQAIGIDHAQGYGIGKPEPFESVLARLLRRSEITGKTAG